MAAEVFDGFDHTQYKDEVIERWGKDAYESGDRWWRSMSDADKQAFQQNQLDIARDFGQAATDGLAADSDVVQAITARLYQWLTDAYQGKGPNAQHFTGLGQMYVDDPRFGANYDRHGDGAAVLVRDAMAVYAERNLQ